MNEKARNWFVVQNGKQIDIHEVIPEENREITVVSNVREGDAHLIAAAPELLAALSFALEYLNSPPFIALHGVFAAKRAERAITKAEGHR